MEVAKWLVQMGTKLKSRDRFGGTPLDDAIREGHKEMVEYL